MSIQSISSNYQTQSTMQTDFQNFRKNLYSLQSAMNSGNQDQVTLSETALSAAITQLQSDFSTQAAGGSNSAQSTGSTGMQSFQNDLQTLQAALNSAVQGTTSTTPASATTSATPQNSVGIAVNQVESDLSSMKGHHHHHHHMGGGSSGSNAYGSTGPASSNSATNINSNSLLSQLLGMLNSNTSSTSGNNSISSLASLLGATNGNTTSLAGLFGMLNSGSSTNGINILT